ncbi:MAG: hypothetical protein EVJ48_02995 [Candidatus Acidulodesulfobacterium acidiphilum]|uniref:Uncharacterized protein n=1 Tax=Candidatus Acidulodesulfobacterium acidiphilum TaxID=2597224 RepID=A0A520XFD7_9DELT|nr:MAG: hypothetical protein EVJ48_02995 [Candidatus Acidulodesulfobacterium acidiphilum]
MAVILIIIVAIFIPIVLLFMLINKMAKDNDPAVKLLKPIEPEEEKGSFFWTWMSIESPLLLLFPSVRKSVKNYINKD